MEEQHDYSGIPPDIDDLKYFAKTLGAKFSNIISIYLFGSVARGDADWKSDVDLLFLVRRGSFSRKQVGEHLKLTWRKQLKSVRNLVSRRCFSCGR